MLHPHHDAVATSVRGWFTESAPEMGYLKEQRRFGVYGRHATAGDEALIRQLSPADIDEFLADVRDYFGGAPVRLYIEDRALDATLRPALLAHGCAFEDAQSYLAHVGPLPSATRPPALTLDDVTPATLDTWVITKLQGFASSDAQPDAEAIAAQVALRGQEMRDVGRLRLARLAGEPAAVLGWYEDADRFIYNLATRLPYRNRGIARYLLCDFLAESHAQAARSVIINADTAGTSITLYQRLGFTDEVYWRAKYLYTPHASAASTR
ncbi:MAG TPA: GNAT family N-acetyltransferase [Ktedonobacterales bacterium]|jgi:ribosomal protein S18 acetylase RimI-like enzyme|nr:GNAT family N-acetyltransferase [Ktedonobacterales bacterium]